MAKKTARHNHHAKHGKIKISQIILIVLLLLLALLVAVLLLTGRVKIPSSLLITPPQTEVPAGLVQAPTPYLLLPQGRQSYLIRSGSLNQPRGNRIVVDPLDARRGEQQVVDLEVEFTKAITSVNLTLITDNIQKTYPMTLSAGDPTKGTWSATYQIEDDHEGIYSMQFIINYDGQETTIDFPIR